MRTAFQQGKFVSGFDEVIYSLDSRKVCHFNNPQITCQHAANNYQTSVLSLNGQFVASQAHCFWGGFYDDRLLLRQFHSLSLAAAAQEIKAAGH